MTMINAIRTLKLMLEHNKSLASYDRAAIKKAIKAMQKHIYYVVLRSEEMADYVEMLYKSKKQAEEYCKKFATNEENYARYVVEIELSDED